jgi:hypothetical protein
MKAIRRQLAILSIICSQLWLILAIVLDREVGERGMIALSYIDEDE